VRVLARDLLGRGEVDRAEQLGHFRIEPGPAVLRVQHQDRPGQVMPHGVHGVERRERVLEDQLHTLAVGAQRPPVPPGRHAVEQDRASCRPDQLTDSAHHGGLPAAALADQGQGLSLFQGERAVVHRPQARSPAQAEVHHEILDF
jgi:hypothetical protein